MISDVKNWHWKSCSGTFLTNCLKFSGSQSKKNNYELIFEQKSTPSWNWSSQLPHHTGHAIVLVNQMKFKNCLRFRFTLIDRVPLWICPPWLWQMMEEIIGKMSEVKIWLTTGFWGKEAWRPTPKWNTRFFVAFSKRIFPFPSNLR